MRHEPDKTKEEPKGEGDLTLRETAEYLSLHIDTVRSLVREGAIGAYTVTRRRPGACTSIPTS